MASWEIPPSSNGASSQASEATNSTYVQPSTVGGSSHASSASSFLFVQNPATGELRPITQEQARDLGLGNSAGARGEPMETNSAASASSLPPVPSNSQGVGQAGEDGSWVMPDAPIQNQGNLHLHPQQRQLIPQQRIDGQNINKYSGQHAGHKPPRPMEHASGDPLFNSRGDWIQRLSNGKAINMGQWRPSVDRGGKAEFVAGGPIFHFHNQNKLSVKPTVIPVKIKKKVKKIYPNLRKEGGGGDLEGSGSDSHNPTSQEARDQDVECGACQQSAGHAAPDAGAGSGDAPGHKHDATRAPVLHKAESKCARLRRTLTKLATKAGFRTANTLCTAIILCIMLFAFLVLAKELGWHVLHPSNSFKDLQ